jgi:hypothetical protein
MKIHLELATLNKPLTVIEICCKDSAILTPVTPAALCIGVDVASLPVDATDAIERAGSPQGDRAMSSPAPVERVEEEFEQLVALERLLDDGLAMFIDALYRQPSDALRRRR